MHPYSWNRVLSRSLSWPFILTFCVRRRNYTPHGTATFVVTWKLRMIFLTENEMNEGLFREIRHHYYHKWFLQISWAIRRISSSSRLGMPTGTAGLVRIDIHLKNVSLEATLGECESQKSGLSPPAYRVYGCPRNWEVEIDGHMKNRMINEIARV